MEPQLDLVIAYRPNRFIDVKLSAVELDFKLFLSCSMIFAGVTEPYILPVCGLGLDEHQVLEAGRQFLGVRLRSARVPAVVCGGLPSAFVALCKRNGEALREQIAGVAGGHVDLIGFAPSPSTFLIKMTSVFAMSVNS